jgi:uncharacterized cupredoxin-like copper-binding protein
MLLGQLLRFVPTVTFEKPGTYEMYCPVDGHEQEGMKGEVVLK